MSEPAVLLVDADPAIRDSLSTLMGLNGFTVRSFATGSALLRALDEGNAHCVICEAELPDTTGVAVYRALRNTSRNWPFALLVSQRNPLTLRHAQNAGITHIFSKPLVHRHLLSFVSACSYQDSVE
jgi:FixJ family two-component response regulator